MTLNTFHFAGKRPTYILAFCSISNIFHLGHGAANVTLGIPRLREIIMTASQKPKTPSMAMTVRPGVSLSDVDSFCKRASRLLLSQIVHNVTVKELLAVNGDARRTEFIIDIAFFPREEYEAEYDVDPSEILAAFGVKFPLILKKEILADMRKLDADMRRQITELGKGKAAKDQSTRGGEQGDDEGDAAAEKEKDDASEVGDGDAEDEKHSRQRKEQTSYESDENEDENVEAHDDATLQAAFENNDEDNEDEDDSQKKFSPDFEDQAEAVADLFMSHLNHATSFEFTESGCTIQLQVSLSHQSRGLRQ